MSSIKLGADSGGGTVALKGPASTTGNANVELKLPVADGSANQVLATNGSGQLQWAADSTNASNLSSGTLPDARFPATLPAVSGASLTGISSPLSFRNLVINGNMQVQQYSSTALTANGIILDRFKHDKDQVGISITRSTIAANAGGPADEGHRYAWKAANTSTTTHNDRYLRMQYNVEAQDLASSGWKYNDTNDNIVISFWIKTSLAGSYQFSLRTPDGSSQSFIHETPSISADTWTKVTKVVPGHANITVNNDTGVGLEFNMWVTVGPSFTTSDRTQNAWVSFDGGGQAKDENVNWGNSGSATFEFTGFQIEVGDAATEFEHRPYAYELARCQRYMQRWDSEVFQSVGRGNSTTTCTFPVFLNTPLRASPTITQDLNSGNWKCFKTNGSDLSTATPSVRTFKEDNPSILLEVASFDTIENDYVNSIQLAGGTNAFVQLSAEL